MNPTLVLVIAVLISPFLSVARLVAGVLTSTVSSIVFLYEFPMTQYTAAKLIEDESDDLQNDRGSDEK